MVTKRTYRLSAAVRHYGCDYRDVTATLISDGRLVLEAEVDGASVIIPLDADAVTRLYMVIDRIDDTNDEAEEFRIA